MNILIVDYGLCNLDSVKRTVQECGAEAEISDDPKTAATAEKIILPGVGNFADAARLMKSSGWDKALKETVSEKGSPLLGICLGMQLLATKSTEGVESEGLGVIPGKVVRLKPASGDERVPHVGWNEVHYTRECAIFANLPNAKDFYFTHSFHFVPDKPEHVIGKTPYCGGFVSAVGRGNIFGVQFHPEKSQTAGRAVIKNFLDV